MLVFLVYLFAVVQLAVLPAHKRAMYQTVSFNSTLPNSVCFHVHGTFIENLFFSIKSHKIFYEMMPLLFLKSNSYFQYFAFKAAESSSMIIFVQEHFY